MQFCRIIYRTICFQVSSIQLRLSKFRWRVSLDYLGINWTCAQTDYSINLRWIATFLQNCQKISVFKLSKITHRIYGDADKCDIQAK